jgi:hypothetical protein
MKIIGLSGKKRSGKNTCGNYIFGSMLKKYNMTKDFRINNDGKLEVLTSFDGVEDYGVFDTDRKDYDFVSYVNEFVWPYVKNYSFADVLKETAITLFGLNPSSVYGTEEQRAEPTHLMWEDMPGNNMTIVDYVECITWEEPRKTGPMSGREFMQFWGTEIGRKMYPKIWINATMNRLKSENSEVAIITDVRFPDEVESIKAAGGIVVRLTREVNKDDHYSETALNNYKNFDYIIDNQNMTLEESISDLNRVLNLVGIK